MIRHDIERTRGEMGDTLDALSYKANVPARTKGWFSHKKDAVTGAGGSGISKLSNATDSMVSKLSGVTPSGGDIQHGAGRMKDTAERNPLGLTLAGAAVGFVAGLFAPSTRVENEKLGPMSDQVKSQAADAGHEALEHGKQVATSAAQSAVETAKEEGKHHSEELSSSLQEKARDIPPSNT
jgi:gas vesicle protein